MSDGTLCDMPASLPLPMIALTTNPKVPDSQRASIPPIYLDAQGMEIYGGTLAFDAARSRLESPCVWDSATGSNPIYFTNANIVFSAFAYDISRSVEPAKISSLAEGVDALATTKLRQSTLVEMQTRPSKFAPESTTVDLIVTTTMVDNSRITMV